MTKEKNNNKNKNQTKNKQIWRWITNSLFLILLGTSIIINITFLPKYFTLKNYQNTKESQIININIEAYDETNDKNNPKLLFSYYYQTIMITLGDVMAKSPETYNLINSTWGRYLKSITYYDENNDKKTIEQTNNAFWAIYYNEKMSPVGIDNLYLNSNDKIKLSFSKLS